MNAAPSTEIVEAVRLESSLSIPQLTIACLILLGAVAVLFWKERTHSTHPRVSVLLLALRILAVFGVWLALANPTAVQRTRRAEPKRASVYLDTSGSMNIQDAGSGHGNSARWLAATGGAAATAHLLDEAIALLGSARVNVSLATNAPSADELRTLLTRMETACRNARQDINKSQALQGVNGRLDPVAAQLDSEVLAPLEHLRSLATSTSESRESIRVPLLSVGRKIGDLRDQIRAIADEMQSSDATPANDGGVPRIEFARRWLDGAEADWLGRIAKMTALDRNQFAQATAPVVDTWRSVKATDPNEVSATTDLQAVLNELGRRASDDKLDFAIVATDGAHNIANQPLVIPDSLARTPMVVVQFGDYDARRDVDLRRIDAPKSILVKDQLIVKARVGASLCEGESATVELLNGLQVLDSKQVHFEGRQAEQFIELRWQPTAAQTPELTVRVRPLAREASLANNERTLKVSVVEDHFAVLVADSMPRWETRYLFSLFRREAQTKATTLLFNPVHAYPGRTPPRQPALPFVLDAWQQFQVVILGDLNPAQFTLEHQKLLKKFVENGGRLVVIAGAESMPQAFAAGPLADLLPVEKQAFSPPQNGFTLKLTPEGLVSDVLRISGTGTDNDGALWSAIYNTLPIYDVSTWSKAKPSARVLIQAVPRAGETGESRVFLATHTFGKGSVAFLSSPSTYYLRWAAGDRYHYRFWGQLVRALVANDFGSGTPFIRLTTDQAVYTPGSSVRVMLHAQTTNGAPLKDLAGWIIAQRLDKVVARTALHPNPEVAGEYTASFEGLPAGTIKLLPEGEAIDKLLKSAGAEAPIVSISIEEAAANLEMLPSTAPPPFFAMVENAPTAMLVAPAAIPAALQYFDLAPSVTETTLRRPLWNEWWLLEAIIGCLALEWIGRKIVGLI